jgi:hypothetical protein
MSDDDGGTLPPNPIQIHIGKRFTTYLDTLRAKIRKGDKVYGIHLGDAVDDIDRAKTTQLMTNNQATIVRAGYDTLRPWVDLCREGVFFVRGTPAHTGQSGYLEELLAAQFNTLRWPKDSQTASLPYLEAQFDGIKLHAAHTVNLGRLPWTRANSLGPVAQKMVDGYRKRKQPPPDIALRGHAHFTVDTVAIWPIRMVVAPCWQMQTEYGNRLSPGEFPDIGGLILTIDGDMLDVLTLPYPADPEATWRAE